MSYKKEIASATVISLIGSVVTLLLNYPKNLLIANILEPFYLGMYSQVLMIIGWAVVLFGFGLDQSIKRYVSSDNKNIFKNEISWVLKCGLLLGFVGTLLLSILSSPISILMNENELNLILIIISFSLPFTIFFYIVNGVLLGKKKINKSVLLNNIFSPLIYILIVIFVWLIDGGIKEIVFGLVVGSVAIAFIGFFLIFDLVSFKNIEVNLQSKKNIFNVASFLTISTLANVVWLKLDIFFLSIFHGSEKVGLYTPSFQTSYLLTYIIIALSSLFSPLVSEKVNSKSYSDLRLMFVDSCRWCFYGNMPIAVTLFICSIPFLGFFGDAYTNSETVIALKILIPSFLFNSLIGSMPTNVLSMGGKHKLLSKLEIIMIPVTIIIHIIFTKKYGVMGAAISASLTLLTIGILRAIYVFKYFKCHVFKKDNLNILIVLPVTYYIVLKIYDLIQDYSSVIILIIIFVLSLITQFVIMFLLKDKLSNDIIKIFKFYFNLIINKSN